MSRIFLLILSLAVVNSLSAQSVGIGTTAPNSSAALEIRSTTKGLLIPSMTTSQRFAIPSPFNGLMVYDTDKNEYYHYNGSSWKPILNGDYWTRPITSRDRIANTTDSIGIGTSGPTERLDVNGNIRSRNNLLVDNNITATGGVSGGSLITSGNVIVGGTSFFNGDATASSDLIINNTTATLQLKSSSVNKGFFQLSGNDVRFGTNSGNSTGNLVIRMNGSNRITVNPSGDIDMDGKLTRSAITGPSSLLPICFGFINYTGSILSGTNNFTVTRLSEGRYRITCTDLNIYSIILLSVTTPDRIAGSYQTTPTTIDVSINSVSISGAPRDEYFYFVVYRPG